MYEKIYIIVYDLTNNKARRELVKILDSYGSRFQYSCYLCFITNKQKETLKKKIFHLYRKKIENDTFNIALIPISKSCFDSIIWLGTKCNKNNPFIIL